MDAALYAKILSDQNITNLKKISYKYPQADMGELIALFQASVYKPLPVQDFAGNNIVYMQNITQVRMSAVKLLLTPQSSQSGFGLKAMEDEISSSFTIESIDFSRDSVRKILQGYAPTDEQENRIYGMKKGLEFIADPSNGISEENIFALYDMAVGQSLESRDQLEPGSFYRNDTVYIIGQDVEHTGLPYQKLPQYMKNLVDFIQTENTMDELLKAAAVHFYFAYLHPYFDGNGRMARLMHMWYLRQQGYPAALFVPFSSYIEQSRRQYYNAYTQAEENTRISGVMDITPFLVYFIEHVYNKLDRAVPQENQMETFRQALKNGEITTKEKELWNFVLSAYGNDEFSTKQLERDFKNAAYATIRGFVLKFTDLGLLEQHKYKSRMKYAVAHQQ